MGNCESASNIDDSRASFLNSFMRESEYAWTSETKILILGTGDSGKSTFMKQLKIAMLDGFSRNEIMSFVIALKNNTLGSMKKFIEISYEKEVGFNSHVQEMFVRIMESDSLTPEVADMIGAVWSEKKFKSFYRSVKMLSNTPESVPYYFENATRFSGTFKPTNQDILHTKLKTTGIFEVKFEIHGRPFTIVDVGGQRAERRKWIHCFSGTHIVLFVIATDDYNKLLEEDGRSNRMTESLMLLEQISKNMHLKDAQFILLFNKTDLFARKIQQYPLSDYFEGINSDATYEESISFIENIFLNHFKGTQEVITLKTCTIDIESCNEIFSEVATTKINHNVY